MPLSQAMSMLTGTKRPLKLQKTSLARFGVSRLACVGLQHQVTVGHRCSRVRGTVKLPNDGRVVAKLASSGTSTSEMSELLHSVRRKPRRMQRQHRKLLHRGLVVRHLHPGLVVLHRAVHHHSWSGGNNGLVIRGVHRHGLEEIGDYRQGDSLHLIADHSGCYVSSVAVFFVHRF